MYDFINEVNIQNLYEEIQNVEVYIRQLRALIFQTEYIKWLTLKNFYWEKILS